MSSTPADYDLLASFLAVAQEKSFTRAAKRRGVTKGTVSRSIARLEDTLGAELLHRNTHAVSLSSAGERLYEQIAGHFEAVDNALKTLPEAQESVAGVLRVTTTRVLATMLLPEPLARFTTVFPDVGIDLTVSDGAVDLVKEGFDVAVRVARSRMRDSNLVARRLGRLGFGYFASPNYLARNGVPDILGATSHDWIMNAIAMKRTGFPKSHRPRFQCDDMQAAFELAVAGLGIAYVPHFVAKEKLREGALEHVRLKGVKPHHVDVFVMYPSSRQAPRKVAAFKDFLFNWVAGTPLV